MARVHHVKKAQKDNPAVKKGEEYWWVQLKTGPTTSVKRYFSRPPKPSQTTTSEYYSQCYEIQEEAEAICITDESDAEDAVSTMNELSERLQEILSELEEKIGSMEDAFPGGCPTLELLQERQSAVESLIDEVDTAASDLESMDWGGPEEEDDLIDQAEDHIGSIGWSFE